MKYIIIFISIFIFSCSELEQTNKEYEMHCEVVKQKAFAAIRRCENKEVICYTNKRGYSGGISCMFKKIGSVNESK